MTNEAATLLCESRHTAIEQRFQGLERADKEQRDTMAAGFREINANINALRTWIMWALVTFCAALLALVVNLIRGGRL